VRILSVILVGVMFLMVTPAPAHHSDAGYDQGAIMAFQGTVTRYAWGNPHITIYVEAEGESGERVEWGVETGSTPIMSRSGWTRDLLAPGDTVTVHAHPDRNHDRKHAMMISLETADGTVWIQDESDYVGSATTTTLAGVWKGRTSTIAPFREALYSHPVTEKGEAARANFDFRTQNPIAQCIPPASPRLLTATIVYLTGIEILDDTVVIRNEFFDAVRTIYMDGRQHPEGGERTPQGHSIGWWEDDVLVVDSTAFADHPSGAGEGVPSGAQKHLVERYSISEDGRRAMVEVLLEDPEYLAEPFRGTMEWDYTPEYQINRYDCVPELSSGFTR